ncbi:MAG: ABC transporter ATP-binding protein [bacterium]|nr:ABC transporter ATP-binding protein [bacterium]
MLHISNLMKKFGNKVAVDGVSFAIKPKEIFALIGPNSSGKTTIVKTIAGLLRSNEGAVLVGGNDVLMKPVETKSIIGYIPDEPTVWSGMTGEEFLHFSGALYGLPPHVRAKKIAELLPIFMLEGIEKEYFESYSRGNKQKFSILAALLHEPKLLLIDEPIVGLDPESAAVARAQFVLFAQKGGAVLLVTHTLSVAQEIATSIGVLRNGKLLSTGTLSELRTKAKLGQDATLDEVYTALTSKIQDEKVQGGTLGIDS